MSKIILTLAFILTAAGLSLITNANSTTGQTASAKIETMSVNSRVAVLATAD